MCQCVEESSLSCSAVCLGHCSSLRLHDVAKRCSWLVVTDFPQVYAAPVSHGGYAERSRRPQRHGELQQDDVEQLRTSHNVTGCDGGPTRPLASTHNTRSSHAVPSLHTGSTRSPYAQPLALTRSTRNTRSTRSTRASPLPSPSKSLFLQNATSCHTATTTVWFHLS
jgi:hypothetical protein